jgi:CubicO group peptidase (beta-lactamase class C family)
VTVIAQPRSGFAYSGGGYEIAEALMGDAAKVPFPQLMAELVLKPAGMERSSFVQPLPHDREGQAVKGHDAAGKQLTGGWHVFPEHAAAGLWSTPTDLANLLLLVGRAWRGQSSLFLLPETAREMLKPQNGGPYGLGASIGDAEGALVVMKRGQNVGYRLSHPASGRGPGHGGDDQLGPWLGPGRGPDPPRRQALRLAQAPRSARLNLRLIRVSPRPPSGFRQRARLR